jgi:hypothetical protein
MVLRAIVGIWAMLQLPNGMISGTVTVVIALVVLFLLWNQRASAFFATN